jgi:imidazolonepropionase-like amidohydrolase
MLKSRVGFVALFLTVFWEVRAQRVDDFLAPPGFRPRAPGIHALVNARVVTRPGKVIEKATIVIRDGLIADVGAKATIPAAAQRHDLQGATVYAGFIEAYWTMKSGGAPVDSTGFQPVRAGSVVNFPGAEQGNEAKNPDGPVYEIHGMHPEFRVVDEFKPDSSKIKALREQGFTSANVIPSDGILRGQSALITLGEGSANELIVKAAVFQHVAFEPMKQVYPHSLMGVIAALRQTFYDAEHYARDWEHFLEHPTGRIRPDTDRGLDALRSVAKGQRVVIETGGSLMVEQAAKLASQFKFQLAIVSCGEEWRRPELAKASGAPFIVPVNFPDLPKMPNEDDWLDVSLDRLRRWDWAPHNPAVLHEAGLTVAFTTHGLGDQKHFRERIRLAIECGLPEDVALAALTTIPAKLCGVERFAGTIEKGKIANLTVVEGASYFDPDNRMREVWVDGVKHEIKPDSDGKAKPDEKARAEKLAKAATERKARAKRIAREPSADRGPVTGPGDVLIENATIWTCGPEGILTNATMLVSGGRVVAFGEDATRMAAKVRRLNLEGRHVTPGLIDCHSHTAILGGVNEATLPSTAMVGIRDVIHSDTENLYQQLAGGLTVANLLHGSANPIGGRNAVIKLRFGAPPSGLLFAEAPKGIKFALGENVKQSNWGDDKTTRFPQSRMGVPTFHANRFLAAKRYLADWEDYRANGGRPPRKNLELEAIGEIIRGERWIHCHSYRQDEMVAFLRVMESFGVRVGTLQHVLEGYKIADEIAKHGAGASSFSDWWAYKFEVYDAIPYSGAMMWKRGVNVSFNSDSSELARRMNLEAAKAVKYGGVPAIEALKFVTINPARQLRVDRWVGSLESGKHADFAIWSGDPLAASSTCLETWIEGRSYYNRDHAAERANTRQQERADLLKKVKELADGSGDKKAEKSGGEQFFSRVWEAMETLGVRHCMDCQKDGGAR